MRDTPKKYHLGHCDEKDVYIQYQANEAFCWITTHADDNEDEDDVDDSIMLSTEMRWELLKVLLAYELHDDDFNALMEHLESQDQKAELQRLMTMIIEGEQS